LLVADYLKSTTQVSTRLNILFASAVSDTHAQGWGASLRLLLDAEATFAPRITNGQTVNMTTNNQLERAKVPIQSLVPAMDGEEEETDHRYSRGGCLSESTHVSDTLERSSDNRFTAYDRHWSDH
jgi:hypothetical protein